MPSENETLTLDLHQWWMTSIHNDENYTRAYQRRAHLNSDDGNFDDVISDYKTLIRMAARKRESTVGKVFTC